jgi:hypothetical protein
MRAPTLRATPSPPTPAGLAAKLTQAGIPGGGSGKISVTATVSGKSITDAFAVLGGATALVISTLDQPRCQETVSTQAGSFAMRKFRVEFQLRRCRAWLPPARCGGAAADDASAFVLPTHHAVDDRAVPFLLPKTLMDMTLAPTGLVTTTQERLP